MCQDCGCEEVNEKKPVRHSHAHVREDGSVYYHTHEHNESHCAENNSYRHHEHSHEHASSHSNVSRTVNVQRNILAENDRLAGENREFFKERGIVAINFISSPGAGKTTLLERTLEYFRGRVKCAVIAGDQQTDNDAKRLKGKGANVVQIETKSACHLNAAQIAKVLPDIIENDTKFLFIENVGNLVCPAAFDLGENFKVVLLSVTEGEDKPIKYPVIFVEAAAVILTKSDLIPHLEWDRKKCRGFIRQINPRASIFEVSCKSSEKNVQHLSEWFAYLEDFSVS